MLTLLLLGIFTQTPYGDYIGDPKPTPEPASPSARSGAAARPTPGGGAAALPSACPTEGCHCDDCRCQACACGLARPKAVALDFKPEPKRTAPPDDRRWFPLSTHPGYYGFGRLNGAGQVVVEQHRFGAGGDVRPGPAPSVAPVLAVPSCANGQCAAPTYPYRRGPFVGSR